MGKSDGRIKHSPEDALVAGWSSERALVSEEMIEILREHGAHVDAGYVHGLTCEERRKITLNSKWKLK